MPRTYLELHEPCFHGCFLLVKPKTHEIATASNYDQQYSELILKWQQQQQQQQQAKYTHKQSYVSVV